MAGKLSTLAAVAAILALGLPIALAKPSPLPPDAALYLATGKNLAAGKGLVDGGGDLFLVRPGLFPILLGGSFWLFGASLGSALYVTKSFAVLLLGMVYLLARRLADARVGFLAAILVGSARYYFIFPTRILLDGAHAALMLATLYLVVRAMDGRSRAGLALAGFQLGVAFLLKQTAVSFLGLPLVLALLVPEYREWGIKFWNGLILFGLSFALAVLPWWAYTFLVTGQVHLLNDQGYEPASPQVLAVALALLAGLSLLLIDPRRPAGFVRKLGGNRWLAQEHSVQAARLLGLGVLVSYLLGIWLGLGGRLGGLAEHALHVPNYFVSTILSGWRGQPLLALAPPAWLLIAYHAAKGRKQDRVLLLSASLYLPLLLLISKPAPLTWGPRHCIVLYLLSYVAMARAAFLGVDFFCTSLRKASWMPWLNRLGPKAAQAMPLVTLVVAFAFSAESAFGHLREHDRRNSTSSCSRSGQRVIDAATWIEQNLPPDSRIMATPFLVNAVSFFTPSTYEFRTVPIDWRARLDGAKVVTSEGGKSDIEGLLYGRRGLGGYYPLTVLLREDFWRSVARNGGGYVLWETSNHPFDPEVVPTCFGDPSRFTLLYADEGGRCPQEMYVFRIEGRAGSTTCQGTVSADFVLGGTVPASLGRVFADGEQVPAKVRILPEGERASRAYAKLAVCDSEHANKEEAARLFTRAAAIHELTLPSDLEERLVDRWREAAAEEASPEAALALARRYVRARRQQKAIETLRRASGTGDRRVDLLLADLLLAERDRVSGQRSIESVGPAGEVDALYRRLLASPAGPAGARDAVASALILAGRARVGHSLLADAIKKYERDLKEQGELSRVYSALAQLYRLAEEHEAAARVVEEMMDRWPNHVIGDQTSAGLLRWMRGDRASAERALRLALKQRPRDAIAYRTLFDLLQEQGRQDEAIEVLKAACARGDATFWAWRELVRLDRTNAAGPGAGWSCGPEPIDVEGLGACSE